MTMPKKIEEAILVVEYDGRFAGWIGGKYTCRTYGDERWISSARLASDAKREVVLANEVDPLIANLDDPQDVVGAFAAFASLAKDRIRIKKCPDGFYDELGFMIIHDFEETEGMSEEEIEHYRTHYTITRADGTTLVMPTPSQERAETWQEDLYQFIHETQQYSDEMSGS